jgi:hypothetical protein
MFYRPNRYEHITPLTTIFLSSKAGRERLKTRDLCSNNDVYDTLKVLKRFFSSPAHVSSSIEHGRRAGLAE